MWQLLAISLTLTWLHGRTRTFLDYFILRYKIFIVIIHQIFLLMHDWSKSVVWLNVPQLKLGNIPNFQNYVRCKKYLKDYKHNSLHFLGHYLFLKDPFSEQIMSTDKWERLFSRQMEAIVKLYKLLHVYVSLLNYSILISQSNHSISRRNLVKQKQRH